MKKSSIEKFREEDKRKASDIPYSYIVDFMTEQCPEGERFKSVCMGDRDWWYVVSYINDTDKHGDIVPLVIVKSYAVNRQMWIYKCLHVSELYYKLRLTAGSLDTDEKM